jgi:hypothetical protein
MRTDLQGPPVLWIEDILLNIFQFLQHEGMVNCEAVCYKWMSFIRCGTPWKKVFQQKVWKFILIAGTIISRILVNYIQAMAKGLAKDGT